MDEKTKMKWWNFFAVMISVFVIFNVISSIFFWVHRESSKSDSADRIAVLKPNTFLNTNSFTDLPLAVVNDSNNRPYQNDLTTLNQDGTFKNVKDINFISSSNRGGLNRSIVTGSTSLNALLDIVDTRLASLTTVQSTHGGDIANINTKNLSGTYVPTFTAGTNVDTVTNTAFSYQKNDTFVTVFGQMEVKIDNATTTAFDYLISLPIASSLSAATQAMGVGTISETYQGQIAVIGDATNDGVQVLGKSVDVDNQTLTIIVSFTYVIV